jgi:Spy/CpxP family protein refolding chaperone
MKTKTIALTLAVAITAGGLIAFTTHAANAAAAQFPLRAKLLERAKEKLGITDEQAAQIKAQLKSEKGNLTTLLTQLHDAREAMRSAIRDSNANESSVRAASAKVAAVEADIAVERMKLFAKISPILTSEQKQKLAEIQSRVDEVVDLAINRIGDRLAE